MPPSVMHHAETDSVVSIPVIQVSVECVREETPVSSISVSVSQAIPVSRMMIVVLDSIVQASGKFVFPVSFLSGHAMRKVAVVVITHATLIL